ncbi:hypothetical protein HPB47_003151, partial [Ixodes persulcatus]
MAEAQVSEEQAVVPEGRVEKVCKEWLVREDGVLAYRLQSQEINQRYNLNRTNNQVLRSDLPIAKTVQRTEEEEGAVPEGRLRPHAAPTVTPTDVRNRVKNRFEHHLDAIILPGFSVVGLDSASPKLRMPTLRTRGTNGDFARAAPVPIAYVGPMEVDDEKIALELQQQLQREAAIHASLQEEDERMALELQRRELPKKLDRIERRRKDDALPAALRRLSLGEESGGADAETVERDSDFSDFCLQPPPGLEGEELRRFQEEQDA